MRLIKIHNEKPNLERRWHTGWLSISQVQPARLNQYTMLELARLPSIARDVVVEDWLEGVYGKAIGPAKAVSEGPAGSHEVRDSDRPPKKRSIRDSPPSEGQVLASRPPTSTERSSLCDVDTEMVERKIYKWRKWASESV